MKNQLESLKDFTSVVADTGEFQKIAQFLPDDATTNPSLILQAVQQPEYADLFDAAILEARSIGLTGEDLVEEISDVLAVSFGCEVLKIIKGRISTEVDAKLSFDTAGSIQKAKKLIDMYEKRGISRDRILIKLATTFECVQACKELENMGINCNMTLLFSFAQARAAAEAGATLISPFVGRIFDWFAKNGGGPYTMSTDPGVQSVRRIYEYYKKHNYKTIVMGASFRNKEQVLGLAGCDKLTIAPKLLAELQASMEPVERMLKPLQDKGIAVCPLSESEFRWAMNEDPMATEKLAEGIRNFHKDAEKLKGLIRAKIAY